MRGNSDRDDDAVIGALGSFVGAIGLFFAGFKYDNWWLIGFGVFCFLMFLLSIGDDE
jgi:hypothetical protein